MDRSTLQKLIDVSMQTGRLRYRRERFIPRNNINILCRQKGVGFIDLRLATQEVIKKEVAKVKL